MSILPNGFDFLTKEELQRTQDILKLLSHKFIPRMIAYPEMLHALTNHLEQAGTHGTPAQFLNQNIGDNEMWAILCFAGYGLRRSLEEYQRQKIVEIT